MEATFTTGKNTNVVGKRTSTNRVPLLSIANLNNREPTVTNTHFLIDFGAQIKKVILFQFILRVLLEPTIYFRDVPHTILLSNGY